MANLRGPIARGEKSGAFALGFSDKMKSVAGAMAVLALATTGTVVVQAQTAPAALAQETDSAAPAADSEDQIIDADMIASGRVTKAANLTDAHGVGKGLISGHVYLTGANGNPGSTIDNGNIPMDGVTVYAQFQDKDGSYSPIFSAKTHTLPDVVGGNGGQGTFAFGTGDKGITWTDKLGVEHTWAARTDQKHRIWVEPFTNERGNKVVMFRQANGFVPGSFNGLVEGPLGSFGVADANIQLMAAFYGEVPPNHENSWMAAKGDKLVEDPEGPISSASTQTNVPNTLSGRVWLETGGPDKGIVATGPNKNSADPAADGYTVYASTLTKDGAAANQKLHEQYKDDPNALADATKRMLEDNPEYILKTVYGKTDNEGRYTLRFGEYEKGQERDDVLNPNHVFVWVENKDGVVQNGYTGFHTPTFQRFNHGGNFRPAAAPGENQLPINWGNGIGFQNLNSLYNVNYALMPYTPVSITADYNATDKPAAPGTTVTPEFKGDLSSLPSKVEWRDQKGNVLKTCELDQSKGIKAQVAACTFDIPDDAKKGDYFNVVLVSGGNDVSAWTVLVTKDADTYEPGYEDGSGQPGSDVKIDEPTFKDKDGKETTPPEGTTFGPGEGAPDGVKIDEETGEITVTIPEDAKPGDKITVPVEVTYPDGSKDNVDVTVTVEEPGDKNADTYEPGYEDGSGQPGSDVKIDEPIFKDKDGKETTPPEGTTFGPGEGAPDGVKIDEETGEITVTIPEDAKPGDKITVPVEVTYPDGSKDNVDVTVTVTEKGDDQGDDGNNTGDDAVKYTPTWKNAKTKPAVPVHVKNERPDQLPEGSKVEAQSDKGWTVTTAPDGTITVTPPADAQHGDKSEIAVTVTYPDGSQDQETFTVTVETDPSWEDGKTTPDEPIVIPNDGGPVKPDTTVEVTDGPGTVGIDDNGNITVTPTDEAEPGDKVVVEVKDPEGNVIDTITVEITEDEKTPTNPNDEPKGNQADDVTPDWENETVKPGGSVEVPNKGDKLPDGSTIEIEVSEDGWTVEVISENGDLKVTPPEGAKHGDKVTVTVTVTYPDGSTDTEKFTVTVVEEKDDQGGDGSTPGGDGSTPGGDGSTPGGDGSTPGGDGSTPGGDGSGPGSSGSSDLPEGLIPGLIGGGIIGGIIGNNLGSSHGSSTPGHGAGKAPADKGAQGADKGAGNQGGKGAGQSGTSQSGQSGAAQSGASSSSAGRQGSLAVTGVSGVAIMLGAAAMALAIGGALLAGRRRREN
ncbi:YPDG domain-containing protein [Corynebacterium urealyticum]|uniref:Gram-positive cocci surface proteins LPxTG domain-containing protein n=1 Tax=Corynebacterium urealyticum TaxID=43771 RepID=A0A5D4FV84_9CORY|nr:YPDG domain-containing protein [Corynebacterium urealyticum]TYR19672.1 hypothetical protein FYJ87_01255 [Corynebacterium urealyticum]